MINSGDIVIALHEELDRTKMTPEACVGGSVGSSQWCPRAQKPETRWAKGVTADKCSEGEQGTVCTWTRAAITCQIHTSFVEREQCLTLRSQEANINMIYQ